MTGPLAGIRALEWAVYYNGPAAGYMLGDLGAEVIKLEQPGRGDPARIGDALFGAQLLPGNRDRYFETANRSKKSISVDFTQEKGREVIYRLVEKADVFFTNLHRSFQREHGLDYETLSRYNSRLIYAHNSGFGSRGPDSELRCFDELAQARSGFMYYLGDRDDPEPKLAVDTLFDQLGAIILVYGILAALLSRERTGIGQQVETSLFNSALHLQAINIHQVLWQGRATARHSRTRNRNPLSNHHQCADGQWIRLAEGTPKYWTQFCQALGMEDLEKDPRFTSPRARRENYGELISILDRVFATRSREEWLRIFRERNCGFAYAPVNTTLELINDPQVIANEYIVDFHHPTMGKTKAIGFPAQFSKTPCSISSAAPELGENTQEVLQNIAGYSPQEILQLKERGVI